MKNKARAIIICLIALGSLLPFAIAQTLPFDQNMPLKRASPASKIGNAEASILQ